MNSENGGLKSPKLWQKRESVISAKTISQINKMNDRKNSSSNVKAGDLKSKSIQQHNLRKSVQAPEMKLSMILNKSNIKSDKQTAE